MEHFEPVVRDLGRGIVVLADVGLGVGQDVLDALEVLVFEFVGSFNNTVDLSNRGSTLLRRGRIC